MKNSVLWESAKVHKLTVNMRLLSGGEDYAWFADWLLRIGEGREKTYPEMGEEMIKIPDQLQSKAKNLDEFLEEIFPGIKDVVNEGLSSGFDDDAWMSWITSRAIISPINDDCLEVNEKMIKKIDGQLFLSKSIDKVHDETEAHNYPTEFLNSIRLSSYPPHILQLKRGVPFMMLRNLDAKNGMYKKVYFAKFVYNTKPSR